MKLNFSPVFYVAVALFAGTAAAACKSISNVIITFFGFPDNDPPGAGTAFNCRGRKNIAGGIGTFRNPLTFASAPGEFTPCEVIYLTYLKKYVSMDDSCAQCIKDWKSGKFHVDVWTGSPTINGGQKQIQCENDLTPSNQAIIRNPDPNYPVDETPLFSNGKCATKNTYPGNPASAFCKG